MSVMVQTPKDINVPAKLWENSEQRTGEQIYSTVEGTPDKYAGMDEFADIPRYTEA